MLEHLVRHCLELEGHDLCAARRAGEALSALGALHGVQQQRELDARIHVRRGPHALAGARADAAWTRALLGDRQQHLAAVAAGRQQ